MQHQTRGVSAPTNPAAVQEDPTRQDTRSVAIMAQTVQEKDQDVDESMIVDASMAAPPRSFNDWMPPELRNAIYDFAISQVEVFIHGIACHKWAFIPELAKIGRQQQGEVRDRFLKNVVFTVVHDVKPFYAGRRGPDPIFPMFDKGLNFLRGQEEKAKVLGIVVQLRNVSAASLNSLAAFASPFQYHPDFANIEVVSIEDLAAQQIAYRSNPRQYNRPVRNGKPSLLVAFAVPSDEIHLIRRFQPDASAADVVNAITGWIKMVQERRVSPHKAVRRQIFDAICDALWPYAARTTAKYERYLAWCWGVIGNPLPSRGGPVMNVADAQVRDLVFDNLCSRQYPRPAW